MAATVYNIQRFSFKGYDQQPPGFSKPGFLFLGAGRPPGRQKALLAPFAGKMKGFTGKMPLPDRESSQRVWFIL